MQVVILAGGKGTRAYPYTEYLPKPMMPVNGKPILRQVMQIFADQGHRDFIVSLGYRKEIIIDYFENRLEEWHVDLVDTGEDTDTGGRIFNLRDRIQGTFMATYVDGLSDIRLDKLTEFHHSHKGLVTITSVPLISQYGTIDCESDGRIVAFKEKPILREHWINAGFFMMDPEVFDHWEGNNLEREVFPALLKKGLLYTYQHDGYFKSMDTYKDQQELEQMFVNGKIHWPEHLKA
jgi:glucose-1-phosphate cytidylyltransferase